MLPHVLARFACFARLAHPTRATRHTDRALIDDALGVGALFLMLFVGLSVPGLA